MLYRRTGVPDAVWLIGAGVLLGPVLGLVTAGQLQPLTPYVVPLILIVVLFESGSRLTFSGSAAIEFLSVKLAAVGFVLSVLAVAAASMLAASVNVLPAGWTWGHAFLLGAILGGASSVISKPALAQAQVEPRIVNVAGQESALTDVFGILVVLTLMAILVDPGTSLPELARSLGFGLALGAVAGFVGLLFLKALRAAPHGYPVMLAVLLVLFVCIDLAGGSAALGILAMAVVLGNAPGITKALKLTEGLELGEEMRGFQSQLAFIIKSFFFTSLGLQLTPPWPVLIFGALLGVVLLAARWPAVAAAGWKTDLTPANQRLLAVCLPRGMAAGVLAMLPVSGGVPGTEMLPILAFAAVLATGLIFAVGFPLACATYVPSSLYSMPAPPISAPPTSSHAVSPTEPDIQPGSGFRW